MRMRNQKLSSRPWAEALRLGGAVCLTASILACAAPSASPAEGGPGAVTSAPVDKPPAPPAASPTAPSAPASPTPTASAPTASAPTASAPTAAPEAPAAPAEAPIPNVKVVNIGMHIGGGENDASEKAPIKQSVEPHFDTLKRCFALAGDQKKGGDFGVDLRIEGAGGKAKVSHPRTGIKGEGFEACMMKAFEAIEFLKPKGGKATMVSYSVRFTPQDR